MAVPKRRTPPAKQGMRRSHHRVVAAQLVRCPQCRSMRANHRVCPVCGTYVVPGKAISVVSGGAPVYFDTEKCRTEFQSR